MVWAGRPGGRRGTGVRSGDAPVNQDGNRVSTGSRGMQAGRQVGRKPYGAGGGIYRGIEAGEDGGGGGVW